MPKMNIRGEKWLNKLNNSVCTFFKYQLIFYIKCVLLKSSKFNEAG